MELHFSDDFFKGEERDGFFVNETMKRAWAAQMVVLADLDAVCKKHRIQWFADSGTLLGAVRHKGFIPWDDDIDIAMLRPDYNKFIKEAVKDLPKNYVCLNIYEVDHYTDYLTRIVNHDVVYPPTEETMEKYYGFPYVCGLDIAPIDYIPRDPGELEVFNLLIEILGVGANAWENPDTSQEERESLLEQIEELTRNKIDRKKPVPQQIRILLDKVAGMYSNREADRVGFAIRQKARPTYNWPKQTYFKSVEIPFENIMIPAPLDYEEHLAIQYGENYMTPRQVFGHDYPFFKKEMEFLGIKE